MPSPQATAIDRSHRRDLAALTNTAGRRMTALARRADPADIDAWWDQASPQAERLVAATSQTAAGMGATYLQQLAEIAGATLTPVIAVPAAGAIATSLLVLGPVAFKRHMRRTGNPETALRSMARQLAGAAASRTLDGQRDTVMATVRDSKAIAGWRRQLNSPRPCAFCVMLASRGAVYGEDTAGFQAHRPGCACTPLPLFDTEPEPASVLELQARWKETTAGLKGRDALNAFRRSLAS